ncbi:MAG TPA: hypothetical protein VG937_01910 [Polyangiaceae bacterium]|nr:hypothetical protein [Polyangiaceae bacterium]
MTWLSGRWGGVVWLLFVTGCSSEAQVGSGHGGASGSNTGGTASAQGGSAPATSGGASAGESSGATVGSGGVAGLGGSGGNPSTGGSAGSIASCTQGADQTCNDNPSVSAILGTCLADGTCHCDTGSIINPSTGKCVRADGPCMGGSCDCRLKSSVELASEAARRNDVLAYRSPMGFVLSGAGTNSAGPPVFIQASSQEELASSQFEGAVSDTALDLLLNVAPIADEAGVERLLVVGRGPGESTLHGVWSTLWQSGATEPSAENRLFLAQYAGQVVTFAIGRAGDGQRVVFSYGHRVIDATANVVVVGSDGLPVSPAGTVTFAAKLWDSLQVVPTKTSAAVSALATPEGTQQIFWDVVELDATGAITFQASARIDDFDDLAIGHKPKMIQTADGYLGRFPSNTNHERFLRIRRTRAADDPAEVWQTAAGLEKGVVDFAALGAGFLFLRTDAGKVVLQRVSAAGEPFAAPLVLSQASPSFESLQGPVSLFAVENTTAYVTFTTTGSRVIAAIECPAPL